MPEVEDYDGISLIYWLKHPRLIEQDKLLRLTRLYHRLSERTDNPRSPVHRYLYALENECWRRGLVTD